MENTLEDRQIVLLWRFTHDINIGDIVVTNRNNPFDEILVKRVIATGGQHLIIQNNQVWIDGELLREDYVKDQNWTGATVNLLIPEGYIFLMGDNRDYSRDSRECGCVLQADLMGKLLV